MFNLVLYSNDVSQKLRDRAEEGDADSPLFERYHPPFHQDIPWTYSESYLSDEACGI